MANKAQNILFFYKQVAISQNIKDLKFNTKKEFASCRKKK